MGDRAGRGRAKAFFAVLVLALSSLGTITPVQAATSEESQPGAVAGELLVGFQPGVPEPARDRSVAAAGGETVRRFDEIDARLIRTAPQDSPAAEKRLQHDPNVRYAEPNFIVRADVEPNDPRFAELWGLHNTGQTGGTADADIDAPEAWGNGTSANGVVVGIIDTGVDFGHPDLGGSRSSSPLLWTNAAEASGKAGVDDDGNGYVDDVHGWDFVNKDNDATDDHGHGTHVAGTIGALGNNGTGVAGVAWSGVKIMPLKFLSASGTGSSADAISAVLYAAQMGADITNNSWGGGGYSQALADAIGVADDAGSLFVAAAGNDGANTDSVPHYPSSYELPNVLSVAATTHTDARASFSNYGAKSVDMGAPGEGILSTYLNGEYRSASGTSMATPHVAGAAALLLGRFPAASDVGLKGLLLDTAQPTAAMNGITRTGGRLDLASPMACTGLAPWIDAPPAGFTVSNGDAVTIAVAGGACGDPTGVTMAADWNGTSVPLTDRGDGLFTGSIVADTVGSVQLTVTASKSGLTDAVRTRSGSVVRNYRYASEPYALVDASKGGTNTGLTADDGSVTVSLPFTFPYYGTDHSSVKIASNGYLVLGGGAVPPYHSSSPIPDIAEPNGVVAPFWSDLNPSAGGSIHHHTVGEAPNRRFVVTWKDVPHYVELSFGRNVGAGTVEVVLEEATGDIVFQYADVVFGDSRYDYGAAATVGVERPDGLFGRQYSRNAAVLQNQTAIRFSDGTSAPTLPAPTNLSATAQPAGAVDLAWTAPSGDAPSGGYNVYRGTAPATFDSVLQNTTSTTISDTPPSDGTYYYVVTAVHGGGESDASNEASAISDRVAPTAPTALSIAAGTGWTEDHISAANAGGVVVDGSKSSDTVAVTLTFSQGGSSLEQAISALGTGTVFVAPSGADLTGFADGTVAVTATASDAAGNVSPASTALSAPKDVVVPTVAIDSGPSGTVDSTTADFAFTLSETGATAACSLDGAAASSCTSPTTYTGLSDGDHTFAVTPTDAAGNQGTSAFRTWTVSTSSGSTGGTLTAIGETPVSGTVDGDYTATQADDGTAQTITEVESGGNPARRHSYLEHKWTFDIAEPTSTVSLTVDAAASGGEGEDFVFQYSVDGGATWSTTGIIVNQTTSAPITGSLVDGTTGTVEVRVRDVNRAQGANLLDTISVDHLMITWEPGSGSGPTEPDASPITVTSASPSKVKGMQHVDLTWTDTGSGATSYGIYRGDGVLADPMTGQLVGTAEGFTYGDSIGVKGSATYTYWVCAGTERTTCSDPAVVTFT